MKSNYTEKAKSALLLAEKSAKKFRQSYVGTEHILIGLIQENTAIASKVLQDNGVDYQKVREMIQDLIAPENKVAIKEKDGYSPKAIDVLEEAANQAKRFGYEKIGTEHILLALIKEADNVAVRLLNTMGVSTQKIYIDTLIAMGEDGGLYKTDLSKAKSTGKQKSVLEEYSRDLTFLAKKGKIDPVIGREDEIKRVIQILSRRMKNNPCLLGEPGVGKTAIVEGLANRIVQGEVPEAVKNKKVLSIDLSAILAGTKYRGEFEERLRKILAEIKEQGNIILFIDEIHAIIGAGDAEGGVDASNILKPAMARGEIQMIGATTLKEYRKYVEKDAALERRLQPVYVEEPTKEETLEILKGIIPRYESHHNVKISEEAIKAAVELSERYIHDRNLPDKAIDVLDEAAAALKLYMVKDTEKKESIYDEIKKQENNLEELLTEGRIEEATITNKEITKLRKAYDKINQNTANRINTVVTQSDVEKIVSVWTKIPVTKLVEKESEKLLKLEKILHQRVIGQNEAVTAVAKAVRRGRVGLKDPNRPIGSFLFLGPTGVGKTELSKALAEAMFDSENSIIRIDMSEYMEGHSVSKMIGSPPGYVGFDDGGQLCEKVRKNPYSVVLFDEIEKAHPDVFNILLQVFDDGHITDAKGRKVSFKNTILIMTSNVGAKRIMEPKNLGFVSEKNEKKDYETMKQNVMEEVKKTFKPEFINRIDEILVFHALNEENMLDIVTLLTKMLGKRCESQMNIRLSFTKALKEYLVKKYADAKMGARPLKRGIQSAIEDALAEEILLGNIRKGNNVTITVKNDEVKFLVKDM